jgi:hypothetical protein
LLIPQGNTSILIFFRHLVHRERSHPLIFLPFQIASAQYFSYLPGMSKVEQIKAQIDALTWEERFELNALIQNWTEDDWDRQMASEGKFDRMMEDAAQEYRAGQSREWPRA